jgi:Cytochrome P450
MGSIFAYMVERTLFLFPDWVWKYSSKYYTQDEGAAADERIERQCMALIANARLAASAATLTDTDIGTDKNTDKTTEKKTKKNADKDANSPVNHITNNGADNITDTSNSANGVNRKSLLDNLIGTKISTESPLSDSEIMSNMKVFYLAGSDTTSVVMTWCIYSLCLNREVLKAVQEEVDSFLSVNFTGEEAVTAVSNLPLCSAVFKESLRLHSPVESILLSVAGSDPVVLSNGIELYKGNEIYVHLDSILKDPNVFIDPYSFNPSRYVNFSSSVLLVFFLVFSSFFVSSLNYFLSYSFLLFFFLLYFSSLLI